MLHIPQGIQKIIDYCLNTNPSVVLTLLLCKEFTYFFMLGHHVYLISISIK